MKLVDRNAISVVNREIAETGKGVGTWGGSQVDDTEAVNYTVSFLPTSRS
jgi:hypothetical protein